MSGQTILAVVGSYRKQGMIDQAVDAALEAAAAGGACTRKIYLLDHPIEFCRNCRQCTQQPGPRRGQCVIDDAMSGLLDALDAADALILAAPVNAGEVTAITRRFLERMTGYFYWPWGEPAPVPRDKRLHKPAVLITASAMPALMARLFTRAMQTLRQMARVLGARPVGTMYLGLAARAPDLRLSEPQRRRALALGRRLARGV